MTTRVKLLKIMHKRAVRVSQVKTSAPKKIINLHANKAICGTVIKKKAAAAERADGSTGYGLSKRDRYGNAYYSYWTKDFCPEEHRQIVYVSVDAAASVRGLGSTISCASTASSASGRFRSMSSLAHS